jgi:hypothetical protein
VATGSRDLTARLWDLPVAMDGPPDSLKHWIRELTGLALDDRDVVHSLDPAEWREIAKASKIVGRQEGQS